MEFLKEVELSVILDAIKNNRDTDAAFRELVVRYEPMMRKRVTSIIKDSCDEAEAMQEAHISLHKAALTYDPEKCGGVTFGLYAGVCVSNRLKTMLRIHKRKSAKLDKFAQIEEECSHLDIESFLATRDLSERVMAIAEGLLSELEYSVFRLEFEGYTTRDIANKLSRSSKSVDNAKARIAKRLRTSAEILEILSDI
jgi:RNA polymerase sporulation-specific sigma factor